MPAFENLQIHCLSLLTSVVQSDSNDSFANLLDEQKSTKMITYIKGVAKGESKAIDDLMRCFDFISANGPEAQLNLSQPLHPNQQKHLKAIYDILYDHSEFQLRSLNKFEESLYSILSAVVNENLNILPAETLTCLQQALLGNEDQQLYLLTHFDEIFTANAYPEITDYIRSLHNIVNDYNKIFEASDKKILEIKNKEAEEDCDYQLVQKLFDEAYDAALKAQAISYPKVDELITDIQNYQYEIVNFKFSLMAEAMKQKFSTEIIEQLIDDAKSWVEQCQKFQHPGSEKLLATIDALATSFRKNEEHKNLDEARKYLRLKRCTSDYKSRTFVAAAQYAKFAKQQGSPEAAELYNDMVNVPLESDINKLIKKINNWLADYEKNNQEPVPEEITLELNRLNAQSSSRKSVDISVSLIGLIDCSFKIIQARNLLAKDNYPDAKEIIDGIKDYRSRHIAISSMETLLEWYLVNQQEKSKNKKTKSPKKVEETETKETPEQRTRRRKPESEPEQKDVEETYHSPLIHLQQNTQAAARKPAASQLKKQISFKLPNDASPKPEPSVQPTEGNFQHEASVQPTTRRVSFQDFPVANQEPELIAPIPEAESIAFQISVAQPVSTAPATSTKRVSFHELSPNRDADSKSPAIPMKRVSSSEVMRAVIMPATQITSTSTDEKTPLLLSPTTQSKTKPIQKNKRLSLWSKLSICQIALGIIFTVAGAAVLTFCPPAGAALIVGCLLVGSGVVNLGLGITFLALDKCLPAKVETLDPESFTVIKKEEKLQVSEPTNFKHPANMFSHQQENTKRVIKTDTHEEISRNTYSAIN